jgi:hypothetical protein
MNRRPGRILFCWMEQYIPQRLRECVMTQCNHSEIGTKGIRSDLLLGVEAVAGKTGRSSHRINLPRPATFTRHRLVGTYLGTTVVRDLSLGKCM